MPSNLANCVRLALDHDDHAAALALFRKTKLAVGLTAAREKLGLPRLENVRSKADFVCRLTEMLPHATRSAIAHRETAKQINLLRLAITQDEAAIANRLAWEVTADRTDPAWDYARLPVGVTLQILTMRNLENHATLGALTLPDVHTEKPAE